MPISKELGLLSAEVVSYKNRKHKIVVCSMPDEVILHLTAAAGVAILHNTCKCWSNGVS